jgi:hypothetical protein
VSEVVNADRGLEIVLGMLDILCLEMELTMDQRRARQRPGHSLQKANELEHFSVTQQ